MRITLAGKAKPQRIKLVGLMRLNPLECYQKVLLFTALSGFHGCATAHLLYVFISFRRQD